jgi:DNA-binding MarR family transcriptional regulator
MADRGLVHKTSRRDDKRGNIIGITSEGKALPKQMWFVYENAIDQYFGKCYSEKETKQLQALVARLITD